MKQSSRILFYNFSSHKFYGLKGSSVLVKKEKVRLLPINSGGEQESGIRGGTSNWPSHVMLSKSLRIGLENLNENYLYVKELNSYLRESLKKINGIVFNSDEECSPYILNVYFKGKRGEVIMNALSNEGIYVSTRSACSSRSKDYSETVYQVSKDEVVSKNSLRISLSHLTTREELDTFVTVLNKIVSSLKG